MQTHGNGYYTHPQKRYIVGNSVTTPKLFVNNTRNHQNNNTRKPRTKSHYSQHTLKTLQVDLVVHPFILTRPYLTRFMSWRKLLAGRRLKLGIDSEEGLVLKLGPFSDSSPPNPNPKISQRGSFSIHNKENGICIFER